MFAWLCKYIYTDKHNRELILEGYDTFIMMEEEVVITMAIQGGYLHIFKE